MNDFTYLKYCASTSKSMHKFNVAAPRVRVFMSRSCTKNAPVLFYLTIISRAHLGYEMIDWQRGVQRRVGYNHLITNKREWNNCFIKNAPKILDKSCNSSMISFSFNSGAKPLTPAAIVSLGRLCQLPFNFQLTSTPAISVDYGTLAHIP